MIIIQKYHNHTFLISRFLSSSFYKDLLPSDLTDSKSREDSIKKLDSSIEEEESTVKPDLIVATMADGSVPDRTSFIQSNAPVEDKPTDDARVVRELSKDSPNSFRTVDTEYDKLLHLLE